MAELTTTLLAVLFSVLMPSKTWFRPDEPLNVKIDSKEAITLVLFDARGSQFNTGKPTVADAGATIDVKAMFPGLQVGTYYLYAVPQGKTIDQFVGTPLVIEMRGDDRPGAPPGVVVTKVEPLCIAKFDTSEGPMTLAFYYAEAPNTVANFVSLARGGFYDGLTFHRVVPGFVVQAGCPLGNSQGGPGYQIDAEFNGKQHREGVISMAREGDPLERTGVPPRPEYANTAGSQFFLCLDYARTKQLDGKYTGFGQLVAGLDTLRKLGAAEIADPSTGRPVKPAVINKIEIVPVTPGTDPYPAMNANTKPEDK
jgi:peptidyl-prolyl cis-trans isomerase B (cyclophilin B)